MATTIERVFNSYSEENKQKALEWASKTVATQQNSKTTRAAWGLLSLDSSAPLYDALVAEMGDPFVEPVAKPKTLSRDAGKRRDRKARKAADEAIARLGGKEEVDSPEKESANSKEESHGSQG